ncbi:MAG: hypothetical protein GY757_54455 [bacterium]|nr:hypothetical protein [bacterium]
MLDGRKEEKIPYWLKLIRSFGGDSPVMVVLNKIDTNPSFDINRSQYTTQYPNLHSFHRLSCKTGSGVPQFLQALNDYIPRMELPKTMWAESWFQVKTRLTSTTETIIPYADYCDLCRGESIDDPVQMETLLDFLTDLGVVQYYRELELQDSQVLSPRWVTAGVYAVITSDSLADGRGVLPINSLSTLLEAVPDYVYPPHSHRYLLQLMRKFQLCFDIDRETILVPDLLNPNEPVLEFPFDAAGTLRLELHYDFLPRSVLPRLMVRLHRDIDHDFLWRSGLVLNDATFGSRAVITGDTDRGLIRVFVADGRKAQYLSVIRHAFHDIHETFQQLGVTERVPLPDNPTISVSYAHLLHLRSKGIREFIPDGAKEAYNTGLLLSCFEEQGALHIAAEIERRLSVLDDLQRLNDDDKTKEIEVHSLLADNLWVLGKGYEKLASDESLKSLLKRLKGEDYEGEDAKRRPDLLLERVDKDHLLLVEFKRPAIKLERSHENQSQDYRDTLEGYFPEARIDIVVMGGPTRAEVSRRYKTAGMEYRSYHDIISLARHELEQWLSNTAPKEKTVTLAPQAPVAPSRQQGASASPPEPPPESLSSRQWQAVQDLMEALENMTDLLHSLAPDESLLIEKLESCLVSLEHLAANSPLANLNRPRNLLDRRLKQLNALSADISGNQSFKNLLNSITEGFNRF